MQIGSHYSMNRSTQSVDRSQGQARLNLADVSPGAFAQYRKDNKYTFTLSGAQVHIADSIAGPEGIGDGSRYTRMAGFLKNALEKSLGPIDGLSIDEVEVDSASGKISARSATPNELAGGAGISYRTSNKTATVNENHITISGTVHTVDGKEKAFCLKLDTQSETSSYKGSRCFATGDAAKNLPMTLFDGVSREISNTIFQFDSDPTSGLLEGKGTNTIKSASSSKYSSSFGRFDWRA